jgi:peptide/nickel transport system permease protein
MSGPNPTLEPTRPQVGELTAAVPPTPQSGRRPNPRIAQWKRTWYFLRRNTLAMVGLGIILFLVILALYALTQPYPWTDLQQYCAYTPGTGINPCGPGEPAVCVYTQGTAPPAPGCYVTPPNLPSFIPPTLSLSPFHPGPLPLGSFISDVANPGSPQIYNLYQGIIRGADWSLTLSVSIVGAGAAIGLMVGAISGYFGGLVDEALMRFVDIMLSIPQLLFVLITVAVVSQLAIFADSLTVRMTLLVLAFVVVWWPLYARIVRGQVLVTREQKFVEAAKASGASSGRIVRKHIIPNSVYPVFVQMSLDVGSVPLLIGGLIFLGFTEIFPSNTFPEWGALSALSVNPSVLQAVLVNSELGFPVYIPWWMMLFPGIMLFMYAISVNFLSDGLRDALDPRLRR